MFQSQSLAFLFYPRSPPYRGQPMWGDTRDQVITMQPCVIKSRPGGMADHSAIASAKDSTKPSINWSRQSKRLQLTR